MKNKRIPFGTLTIGQEARDNIQDCIDRNYVTMGEMTAKFEEEFSSTMSKTKVTFNTVACNSGTSAVTMACLALYERGADRGDYVIVPGLSFIATATAVSAAGFEPLFIDIDRETLNINTNHINESTNNKLAGIIGVNTMGKPCDVADLRQLAAGYNVPLIIDNCEGHGCEAWDRRMEQYADMCCYSFYPAHAIVAGEMGAVTTYDDGLTNVLRSIRNHGRELHDYNFNHVRMGGNFKPVDLVAAIGLEGIHNFNGNFIKRKNIVRQMRQELSPLEDFVYFSEEEEGSHTNCPHAFSVVLKSPTTFNIEILKKTLTNAGIEWKSNFGVIPNHGAFKYSESNVRYISKNLPNSLYAGKYGLHWGCHQSQTTDDASYVCDTVKGFFGV